MKKNMRIWSMTLAFVMTASLMTGCSQADSGYTNSMIQSAKPVTKGENYYENMDCVSDEAEVYYSGAVDLPYAEEYNAITENGFISTAENRFSTFSVDVDTASYSNVRRMLQDGWDVEPDAVRIEEMINYFSYDYPAPKAGEPFSVTTEISQCPWNPNNQLMLVGLQTDEIDLSSREPMNLVFLIDVSGSMYSEDKLPLVQKAVAMLAEQLNENDRVSVVTYAGSDTVVMEGVTGDRYAEITEKIYALEAGGSTAGAAGINTAYNIAEKYFIKGGNNRILLATDGDLNVGLSTEEELKALVEEKREGGVNLSVLGFGTGNLKDNRLEALADNGNGNYSYIDSELEAEKVLVQEMGGTLYTVAKDVKIQAEFNADVVESYRLIGYENRVLNQEDFTNDKVDAGEIGAGHSVTALYELVMQDEAEGDVMNLALRYKAPDGDESVQLNYPTPFVSSPVIQKNLAFAAAVTEFGMLLRNSVYAGISSYPQILDLLNATDTENEYRQDFYNLAKLAFAGKPQYDRKTELPATENPTANIPEPETETVGTPVTVSDDYTFTATYKNEPAIAVDGYKIKTILEQSLDYRTLMDTALTQNDIDDCKANAWYVNVTYPDAVGRELLIQGVEKPLYIYEIMVLWDETHQWAVLNNGGTYQVLELPQWAMEELTLEHFGVIE